MKRLFYFIHCDTPQLPDRLTVYSVSAGENQRDISRLTFVRAMADAYNNFYFCAYGPATPFIRTLREHHKVTVRKAELRDIVTIVKTCYPCDVKKLSRSYEAFNRLRP